MPNPESTRHPEGAPTERGARLWRVVVESLPEADAGDEQADVTGFQDYESAWLHAHAFHARGQLVQLVDPAGRVLVDTNLGPAQAHVFRQDRTQATNLPPGTYRWQAEFDRYERVDASLPEETGPTLSTMEPQAALASLLGRRSVSPKRLGHPGPTPVDLHLMLQAALRAPDHGGLHPWRVIEFRDDQRAALGEHFVQEKLRRDPLASASDLLKAREHALRPPALLAFVVTPRARSKVPVREQWLAGGAALGNLLQAAHHLGFGAIVLSGERCFDAELLRHLDITGDEFLAGFVSIGRIAEVPPAAKTVDPAQVWSSWAPGASLHAASAESKLDDRDA